MLLTVLIYAVFTGLSGLAQTWWQLAGLQALAGIGLGGEWAAGAALVAETWPERTRARAMQVMQLCFGLGFFAAATLNLVVGPYGWRWVFVAGVSPAPIILLLRCFVTEPARWVAVRRQMQACGGRIGPMAGLRAIFAPSLRRRTIVAVLIALTFMVGSNGLGPLMPIWVHQLLPPARQALAGTIISQYYMLMSLGGLVGYICLMSLVRGFIPMLPLHLPVLLRGGWLLEATRAFRWAIGTLVAWWSDIRPACVHRPVL
jgi:hypothetical protein